MPLGICYDLLIYPCIFAVTFLANSQSTHWIFFTGSRLIASFFGFGTKTINLIYFLLLVSQTIPREKWRHFCILSLNLCFNNQGCFMLQNLIFLKCFPFSISPFGTHQMLPSASPNSNLKNHNIPVSLDSTECNSQLPGHDDG